MPKNTLIILLMLSSLPAQANDLCALYANAAPIPDWYDGLCKRATGSLQSAVGGAFSTFADSFNLNPASLPTLELPIGAEAIASVPTSSDPTLSSKTNFALIKSHQGVGFGLSTNNDNSIYSNRANHAATSTTGASYSGPQVPSAALPTISLGTALSLERLFLQTQSQFLPQLGVILRYNNDQKNWSPGLGFTLNVFFLSLGFSLIKERASEFFPETTVLTQDVGLKIWKLQFELVSIFNSTEYYFTSNQIESLSAEVGGFLLSGAARRTTDSMGASSSIYHFGIQRPLSPHLALAYLYNYVPGYQSLSAQITF